MAIYMDTTENEKDVLAEDTCRWLATRQPWELTYLKPFAVSLSNHERPFDILRAKGLDPIFVAMTGLTADRGEREMGVRLIE